MNLIFLLTGIFLIFGLVVLLPLFIKFLNRHDKRLKLLLLIPLIFIGYSIYTAIYPTDNFYKQDFREVTGVEFPETGEIIFKTASFPDHFGDYGSVSIVKVDKEFYERLKGQLKTKGLTEDKEDHGPFDLKKISKEIGDKKIEKEYCITIDGGVFYYVGFLSDRETIIVNRQSW